MREEEVEDLGIFGTDPVSPINLNPSGEGTSVDLARAAKEVAVASSVQLSLTTKILDHLERIEETLTGDQTQPPFEACVAHPDFVATLVRIDEIVHKYEDGHFRPADMDRDILKLGSLLFYLSGRVNNVEMIALDAESATKTSVSRAFIEAKDIASDQKGRLSDETAKALALVATERIRNKASYKKVVAHTAKGLYYAGAHLLKMMDNISRRAYNEKFQPGQA